MFIMLFSFLKQGLAGEQGIPGPPGPAGPAVSWTSFLNIFWNICKFSLDIKKEDPIFAQLQSKEIKVCFHKPSLNEQNNWKKIYSMKKFIKILKRPCNVLLYLQAHIIFSVNINDLSNWTSILYTCTNSYCWWIWKYYFWTLMNWALFLQFDGIS